MNQVTETVTITVDIENYYVEDDETIITNVTADVHSPSDADFADELTDWAYNHIFALTGTDRHHGDATYDVEITASTDPRLIGRTFEYGY